MSGNIYVDENAEYFDGSDVFSILSLELLKNRNIITD